VVILYKKDKEYPVFLMKQECKKRDLNFVVHCGMRSLLYNGGFLGLTTLKEWNSSVEKQIATNFAKDHFLKEVSFILRHDLKYIIRSKDLANNQFLISLVESKMCNGIGIYSINKYGVVGYFFNAKSNNQEAIQFFINQMHLFQEVVNVVDKKLETERYWDNILISDHNKNVFNTEERRLIFSNKKMHYCSSKVIAEACNNNKLTRRETQILSLLRDTSNTKDLANVLGIGTRTVESHLSSLRKKMGVYNTKNLTEIK